MRITKILQAKRKQNRVHIYLDDVFAAAIDKDLLLEFDLYVNKSLGDVTWAEILSQEAEKRIFTRLYDFCLIRPRSGREIARKLTQLEQKLELALPPETKERLLSRLTDFGFTDENFARWLVDVRSRGGKVGKQKVYAELLSKGIAPALARRALNTGDWLDEVAQQSELLQKKFGVSSLRELADRQDKARAYRFLVARGFRPKF